MIFASATTASPAATASELLGHTVVEVTDDGSPQGGRTVALWEPALLADLIGENGAPVRRSAGAEAGAGDGGPDGRGGADVDVRPLAPRRRTHRARRTGAARGRRTGSGRPRRVLPRRLPGRGPSRPGERTGGRSVARAGHHQRPRAGRRHRGSGRRGAGRLPRHRRLVLAAGRARGPTGPERVDRHDRARRPAGHLPRQQSGRAAGQAHRTRRDRPRRIPTCSVPNCSAPQPNSLSPTPRCGCGTPRPLPTRSSTTGFCGGGPRVTSPRPASIRILRWTSAGRPAGRSRSSSPAPAECSAARARARRLSSVHAGAVYLHQGESYLVDSLDFEDGIAFVRAEDPGYTTSAREVTDIVVTGPRHAPRIRTGHDRSGAGVGVAHRGRLSCVADSTAR